MYGLQMSIFQRHQLMIGTSYLDFFFIIITTIHVRKKLRMGFEQASSIVEKLNLFINALTRHKTVCIRLFKHFLNICKDFSRIIAGNNQNYFNKHLNENAGEVLLRYFVILLRC